MMNFIEDKIVLSPNDIDLTYSPIRKYTGEDTYVLGAFNPGFTRLPNGNCLMMVRVAEALKEIIEDGFFKVIRWCPDNKYIIDKYSINELDTNDPRKYRLLNHKHVKVYGHTTFSWILPVE